MLTVKRALPRHPEVWCHFPAFGEKGFDVIEHRTMEPFFWDRSEVGLFVAKSQIRRKYTDGHKVLAELAGKPLLNVHVLNLLLREQHLIPKEWQEKVVCFWGTIYRDLEGELCIRTLYSGADGWVSDYLWLNEDYLTRDYPAAIRSG